MLKSLLLTSLILLPALSWAEQPSEPFGWSGREVMQLAQAKTISRKQAIEQAQKRQAGRVLSAELETKGGKAVYQVKILTPEGRVKTISINAQD